MRPEWVDGLMLSLNGLRSGKVYELITFQFLHGGLWHLLGNMIGLYFFGRAVEALLGSRGMLTLYLVSGTVGGLLQVGLACLPKYPDASVVGASAGVFGLIAAFAVNAPDDPITLLLFFILPVTFPAKVPFVGGRRHRALRRAGAFYAVRRLLGWPPAPASPMPRI